ncbi:scavenger receptor class B member 1 isoform X2 [Eublepharis macularius]|uniref:Scavenger receptor class B member 1 n=1 Tax=Eublepharis macularius TaxID=481883 RepID=A0AA97K9A6_EUBMA|nr:scavenger receptor class B member 1 isoform X2 [Eublepharis macularius]
MTAGAPRCAALALGLLGTACLALGVVLLGALPIIVREEVIKNVRIQPDSSFFQLWKEIPVPFYFSVYIFEVLNPNEVLNGMKPAVRQRGPYVYREFRDKKNITFHKNYTVSFLEYRRFYFQPDMSNGTEEDYVVVPNILALGGAVMMEHYPPSVRVAISTAFSFFKQKGFMNRTVGEILWGYEDPLLKFLNTIKPGLVPFNDKFGLFVDFNNSHMGMFTVNTGVDDISKVQMVDNWNGLKKVSYWRSDQCNQINGTAGELWPPFITPSTPIEFYSADACRSMRLQYKDSGEFQGIPVYRYVTPKTLFANGTDYPPNEGFCPCRESGIQNVSSCRLNAPVFLSQPHFYNADPALLETVDGLHPSEQKHGLILELHPLTGSPLNVSVRLQLSLFIKRVPLIIQTQKINPVVLPMLWFEERGVIEGHIVDQFYTDLVLIPSVLGYLQYCAVALGSVLLIITIFLWLKSKGKCFLFSNSNREAFAEKTSTSAVRKKVKL